MKMKAVVFTTAFIWFMLIQSELQAAATLEKRTWGHLFLYFCQVPDHFKKPTEEKKEGSFSSFFSITQQRRPQDSSRSEPVSPRFRRSLFTPLHTLWPWQETLTFTSVQPPLFILCSCLSGPDQGRTHCFGFISAPLWCAAWINIGLDTSDRVRKPPSSTPHDTRCSRPFCFVSISGENAWISTSGESVHVFFCIFEMIIKILWHLLCLQVFFKLY